MGLGSSRSDADSRAGSRHLGDSAVGVDLHVAGRDDGEIEATRSLVEGDVALLRLSRSLC
jgi:hypothetical protein